MVDRCAVCNKLVASVPKQCCDSHSLHSSVKHGLHIVSFHCSCRHPTHITPRAVAAVRSRVKSSNCQSTLQLQHTHLAQVEHHNGRSHLTTGLQLGCTAQGQTANTCYNGSLPMHTTGTSPRACRHTAAAAFLARFANPLPVQSPTQQCVWHQPKGGGGLSQCAWGGEPETSVTDPPLIHLQIRVRPHAQSTESQAWPCRRADMQPRTAGQEQRPVQHTTTGTIPHIPLCFSFDNLSQGKATNSSCCCCCCPHRINERPTVAHRRCSPGHTRRQSRTARTPAAHAPLPTMSQHRLGRTRRTRAHLQQLTQGSCPAHRRSRHKGQDGCTSREMAHKRACGCAVVVVKSIHSSLAPKPQKPQDKC